jgi:hypothetical protein
LVLYICPMGEYSLGDALKGFINKSKLRNGIRAVQIEEVWEQVMGKTIAKYTEKIEIINQTLFIRTNIGPLKNELSFQKPQIIQRINEAFNERVITQVVIQ